MILQALKEYYDRLSNDPDSSIPPLGWEKKEIPFLIAIDTEGNFINLEDTREQQGKKLIAKSYLVPQSVKRTSGIAPNLLWDNVEYVTGIVCDKEEGKGSNQETDTQKSEKRKGRVEAQHQQFVERIETELSDTSSVLPVLQFLHKKEWEKNPSLFGKTWADACETNAFISFKLVGHDVPIFREPDVIPNVGRQKTTDETRKRRCLDGTISTVAQLHSPIKGVAGAKDTGGNIVSFNAPAFCSFGKRQGENIPISTEFVFQYTTALNTLLGKGSRQKTLVGDATMVWWASQKDIPLENGLINLFEEPEKGEERVSETAIEQLLQSVETGAYKHEEGDAKFYVLGLAPNAARLSVRFWHVGTVQEMEGRFREWFEDLRITHGPRDKQDLSLWRLLVSTAPQGKTENISPNLAGNIVRSILEGLPLPETLLGTLAVRFKADHDISYPRVKLLKAYFNRKWRFYKKERSLTMSLDKGNTNIGYRLGRLFAVLEKIQQEANPGINATIRDKFYSAASSTPASVFGNLMRLKNHHLSKLESPGRATSFEKLLGEIFYRSGDLPGISKFPAHLTLDDQGMFAIGYYHQRQDFFTKKTNESEKLEKTMNSPFN